jgi:hypothetical protein
MDAYRLKPHLATGILAEAPGIAPRDVMVVITSTQAEDWSFSDGIALIDATTA